MTSHKNCHLDHGQILAALQGAQVGQIMVTVVCENIGQQISNMSNFFLNEPCIYNIYIYMYTYDI